jgi:hypothetical protein
MIIMETSLYTLIKYLLAFVEVLVFFFINVGIFVRAKITPFLFEKIFKARQLSDVELEILEGVLKEEIKFEGEEFVYFLINMIIINLVLIIAIKFIGLGISTLFDWIFHTSIRNSLFYDLIMSSLSLSWLLTLVFASLLFILKKDSISLVEKFLNNTRKQYLTILEEAKKKRKKQPKKKKKD